MTPAEMIREAKCVLFERGWHQGDSEAPDGSVCVRGALGVVADGCAWNLGMGTTALQYLREAIGRASIINWNDDPDRSFGEVIDALDRAEKIAEALS